MKNINTEKYENVKQKPIIKSYLIFIFFSIERFTDSKNKFEWKKFQ